MLKNDKIILNPVKKKHLNNLRSLRNSSETNYYLTSIIPVNEYQQEAWFKKISLDETKMCFAIENKNSQFIGFVRGDEWDRVNRSIRIGVDIVPEFRRKGFATNAYKLLLKYLFQDLGINRVWLLVVDYNEVAMSLYKKVGFRIEGKQREAVFRSGKFHTYIMMSILKSEYEKQAK